MVARRIQLVRLRSRTVVQSVGDERLFSNPPTALFGRFWPTSSHSHRTSVSARKLTFIEPVHDANVLPARRRLQRRSHLEALEDGFFGGARRAVGTIGRRPLLTRGIPCHRQCEKRYRCSCRNPRMHLYLRGCLRTPRCLSSNEVSRVCAGRAELRRSVAADAQHRDPGFARHRRQPLVEDH